MKTKPVIAIVFFTCSFATCNSQQKGVVLKPTADAVYTYGKASADGIGKYYYGREISHVMGASGSEWLERDNRNQEENTNLAIEKIIIKANGVIADIGAGTGYYSFKLSPKVSQGKVYAVEIQDELIDYLKNKKDILKDSVVEVVKGSDHSPNLPDNSIDLAILVDVYHELEFPYEMLQAIRKSLKTGGKILLLEYRGEDPSIPIKALHKTTVLQLRKEFKRCGFQLAYKGDFLPIQHFLLFEKE
ncbi:MAG: class I SAM-dependent methyltransferase [Chitinophagaceae bacterium]